MDAVSNEVAIYTSRWPAAHTSHRPCVPPRRLITSSRLMPEEEPTSTHKSTLPRPRLRTPNVARAASNEANTSPAGEYRVVTRPSSSRRLTSKGPDKALLDRTTPTRKMGISAQGSEGGARTNVVPTLAIIRAYECETFIPATRNNGPFMETSGTF